jgi:hypothetical protein
MDTPIQDQPTEHLLACLEAWRAVDFTDATARAIEAELAYRGVQLEEEPE